MLLLRRLLPYLVAALSAFALFWQARSPWSYPWFALIAPLSFAAAGAFIGGRRIPAGQLISRLLPSVLALVALGYGLLLAEGVLARWLLPLLGGGVSFIALELLFLLTFLPARYPVNGLSHFNLSLVPVILFLVHHASVGLVTFIHASRAVPVLAAGGVSALLFWATAHVESSPGHRRRWAVAGGWLGVHTGLLGAFLPVSITLHGAYAALLAALAVRTRRYGITPQIPRSLVMAEVIGSVILLILMLGTARWV